MKISPQIVSGRLQVTFNRRVTGTHDLTYQVQQSSDLKNWSPFSATEISTGPAALDGFETVTLRANSPIAAQSAVFLRLLVTMP